MTASDTRRVSYLGWIGVFAAGLAVLASFFPWYTLSGRSAEMAATLGTVSWRGAWGSGPTAWVPVLLLVLAGLIALAPHFNIRFPGMALVWLVLSCAALVLVIARSVTFADPDPAPLGLTEQQVVGTASAGWGLYLGLIAAVISAFAALARWRVTR